MPETQSAKHHARYDPIWHFFVAPVLLLNVFVAIYFTVHDWPGQRFHDLWWIVVSVALFLLAATTRSYSLKVQDRVIRLEERLRLGSMLTPAQVTEIGDKQLIALRFASDAEAGALARRAVAEKMEQKAIKDAVVSWRPDHHRV